MCIKHGASVYAVFFKLYPSPHLLTSLSLSPSLLSLLPSPPLPPPPFPFFPPSWLDGSVAREAARAWGLVAKEAAHLPSTLWFLHVAACESKLFIHAGNPVGTDPSSPLEGKGEY